MPVLESLTWSADVAGAGWLSERLDHGDVVTGIVPSGFEAYARVLHPADDPTPGGRRLVRWRDIAAWAGRPLAPDAPFHSVALPDGPVRGVPPWSGAGPRKGRLAVPDAEALFAVTRRHTRTPEDCWFCLWDGYDSSDVRPSSGGSPLGTNASENLPATASLGCPRVELRHRSYLLYRGPVESALVHSGEQPGARTANLWWPEDRAWCVATEVDLAWTYVGGSVGLVRSLVGDPALEAVEVAPGGSVAAVEPRLNAIVRPAVQALLHEGSATLVTPVGTVIAAMRRPRGWSRGWFRFDAHSPLGTDASGTRVLERKRADGVGLRREIESYMEEAVIGLVDG